MRKPTVCLWIAAALLLCACTGKPGGADADETPQTETGTQTAEADVTEKIKEEVHDMQLIPDVEFRTGMKLVTQRDHKNGDSFSVFGERGFYGGKEEAGEARWRLVQWDSGPDLSECIIDSDGTAITDGKWRTFAYDPSERLMTFRLDTSAYYQGRPAVSGGYWPHLLIEQDDFGYRGLAAGEREFYNCQSKSIVLSMDIRLGDYSETPIDGDWVRAAQFLLYFYVKGINTNDFCWFGIQLFDNRWAKNGHYIGIDGASGQMIYSIGSEFVYPGKTLWRNGCPQPNGDWVHIELNIRPYLDDMLRRGLKSGCFEAGTLDGFCINGMNMGWETIGTFDHTMYVKNLALISCPDGR